MALKKKTIEFINSLDHDDLVCFISVYSDSTKKIDIEQYEALKKEMLKKLATDETEKQLWDTEVTSESQ